MIDPCAALQCLLTPRFTDTGRLYGSADRHC